MRRLLALLLGTSLAACAAAYTPPSAGPLFSSVVMIKGAVAEGSGVAVGQSSDGHTAILTADHVVRDNPDLKIAGFPVTVVSEDKAHDLALLDLPTWIPTVDVLPQAAMPGTPEVTVGFPLGMMQTATPGFFGGYQKGLQGVTGSMWPGNSGGGVFVYQDGKWQLAGIADAIGMRMPHTPFEKDYDTIGLAVPANLIEGFLRDARPA